MYLKSCFENKTANFHTSQQRNNRCSECMLLLLLFSALRQVRMSNDAIFLCSLLLSSVHCIPPPSASSPAALFLVCLASFSLPFFPLSRVSLLKMCPIHFFCRPRIVPISDRFSS